MRLIDKHDKTTGALLRYRYGNVKFSVLAVGEGNLMNGSFQRCLAYR